MSCDITVKIFEGEPLAAFDHSASGEIVARSDIIESLENESSVGALIGFGRSLTKSDRDAIGASLHFVFRVKACASVDV